MEKHTPRSLAELEQRFVSLRNAHASGEALSDMVVNDDAFQAIFKEACGLLNCLPDPNDQDDVRQEASLHLTEHLINTRGAGYRQNFHQWLEGLARLHLRWALLSYFRARKREVAAYRPFDEILSPTESVPPGLEDRVWRNFVQHLMQLPDNQRKVVKDDLLFGLSVRESSRKRGLTEGTVRVLRSVGRKKLKQAIRSIFEELPLPS